LAINDGTGYFEQHGTISSPNNWAGAGANVTRTLRWDLDQYFKGGMTFRNWLASNTTPSHVTLWLVSQSGGSPTGGPGRIHFDNIRLVPEPVTLTMLGLAISAYAIVARRRRS
jgi:hypothetical protein